jgi:phosphopantetheine--protein transferase-like protein
MTGALKLSLPRRLQTTKRGERFAIVSTVRPARVPGLDKNGPQSALRAVQAQAAEMAAKHADALAWQRFVCHRCAVVWLPLGWAGIPESATKDLVSPGGLRRIRGILRRDQAGLAARVRHFMDECAAMQGVVRAVLGVSSGDSVPARDLFVRYTLLGQPRIGWRGRAAEWARERGIHLRDLHISFTHDGEAVIALAGLGEQLRGVGIDVVRLARFEGRSRDYLHRFARHFMSESEYRCFLDLSGRKDRTLRSVIVRAAAHFSLMEAASKALGTGLKIGGGMGKPESLPKRSINVQILAEGSTSSESRVTFNLEQDADDRMRSLGAGRLEGYFSADSEYLVSAVFLSA